ncbi:hypothetical protein AB0M02_27210 [Actinoplanes sp. NPDC051861]|uniref:hypothetical protein n=1 Tax=Actinoplanes sp. NPDC051861 TaxID=3155170 RepID=UPI00343B5335
MNQLDAVASAFRDGGLRRALAVHRLQRRRSLRYAIASAPIEAVVPLDDVCAELVRLGDDVARLGIGGACRAAMRRWDLEPVVVAHPRVWELMETGPFLAVGNHATGLEAGLFSSLADRFDLYHLAGTFVATASPGLSSVLLTLDNPAVDAPVAKWPLRERMLRTVEGAVWPGDPHGGGSRRNLATLRRAADLINGGAGVHIFPAGSMHPGSRWQPGVGWLVRRLQRAAPGTVPHVVAVVYGVTDAHLAASALFRRRPWIRALARAVVGLSSPLSLYAPAPVRVDRLGIGPHSTSREATAILHELWRTAHAEAARAVPCWRRAPAVLGAR